MTQRFSNISAAGLPFALDLVNQGKSERNLTIQARRDGASASMVAPRQIMARLQQIATADSQSPVSWRAEPTPEPQRTTLEGRAIYDMANPLGRDARQFASLHKTQLL